MSQCPGVCSVCQLAGTAVLAVGLWLRFDSKTKGLFEGADSPYVFYTGELLWTTATEYMREVPCKTILTCGCVYVCVCVCVCVCGRRLHPDRSWSSDDGGGFPGLLWSHPGVSVHAGTGKSNDGQGIDVCTVQY